MVILEFNKQSFIRVLKRDEKESNADPVAGVRLGRHAPPDDSLDHIRDGLAPYAKLFRQ